MDETVVEARERKWLYAALDSAPRLHVFHDAEKPGNARVYSTNQELLYQLEDARTLGKSDPLSSSPGQGYWRLFLKRGGSQLLVAEVRRHEAIQSAVGFSLYQLNEHQSFVEHKTGLEVVQAGLRWKIAYAGQLFHLLQTKEAPNTTPGDASGLSYKLMSSRAKPLAWYASELKPDNRSDGPQRKATLWFEQEAIEAELVDFAVCCLLAASDVVTPIRLRNSTYKG